MSLAPLKGAILLFNQKRFLMSKITKRIQPSPKATVCFKENCITVYDEVADVINAIAIAASLVIAVSLVAKVLK